MSPTSASASPRSLYPSTDKGKARALVQDAPSPTSDVADGLGRLEINSSGFADRVDLVYRSFEDEDRDLPGIQRLCEQELSEPCVNSPLYISPSVVWSDGADTTVGLSRSRWEKLTRISVYTYRYFLQEWYVAQVDYSVNRLTSVGRS